MERMFENGIFNLGKIAEVGEYLEELSDIQCDILNRMIITLDLIKPDTNPHYIFDYDVILVQQKCVFYVPACLLIRLFPIP